MKNISVIGVGKLGLAFSLTLEKAGFNVLGVDVNQEYISALNSKSFVSDEPGITDHLQKSKNFMVTDDVSKAVLHADILFVIVATPSLPNGRYDHSQVEGLVNTLEKLPRHGQRKHFIVCCTTMPGYCDTLEPRLSPLNYTVSYNPEFIAQGTILKNQAYPDMVLIGEGNKEAGDILQEIYEKHTENAPRICRMSRTEAELTKLALNCFLTTKIAYANMVGDIALSLGGDPEVVLGAIGSDSRIGNKYLGFGYGYGGPCFPRDNRALALCAGDVGRQALISVASDESNKDHLSNQIAHYVDTHPEKSKVSFDFVTYKPESTLLVESQQLAFAAALAEEGYPVEINERPGVIDEIREKYGDLFIYVERKEND
jgi:nucleotide sugar dehydrogenase